MDEKQSTVGSPQQQPFQIRLPGFIVDEAIGLGDVIKRATRIVGIKPCEPCHRRAEIMNRWLVLTSRKGK